MFEAVYEFIKGMAMMVAFLLFMVLILYVAMFVVSVAFKIISFFGSLFFIKIF